MSKVVSLDTMRNLLTGCVSKSAVDDNIALPPNSKLLIDMNIHFFDNKQEFHTGSRIPYNIHPFADYTDFIFIYIYYTGRPFQMSAKYDGKMINYSIHLDTTNGDFITYPSNPGSYVPGGFRNYTMYNELGYNFSQLTPGLFILYSDMNKFFDDSFIYLFYKYPRSAMPFASYVGNELYLVKIENNGNVVIRDIQYGIIAKKAS